MSNALVILLHGVGSRGADMASLGQYWQKHLPDATFAQPDAPFPFDHGGMGRQWFSISNVTEANRAERIRAARVAFDDVLNRIIHEHGFSGRLDRVALVGFSQGSIMALDAVVSGRWPVAAVLAFSGRLASPEPFAAASATPICLIHGDADPIMPVNEARKAESTLVKSGYSVSCHIMPNVAHGISPEGAAIAGAFLADRMQRIAEKG